MPSYATQITRGGGRFRYRLEIEGWPAIFVSDASLVRVLADGRSQLLGLLPSSIRIAARADLWRAGIREQEMTAEIVDDDDRQICKALHRAPTATTHLRTAATKAATTIEVHDTSAFESSGVIHIGTEAITYSGKSATSFTGCTRGVWGTVPQAHAIERGEREAYPRVTNLPVQLRDRRVWIWMYGSSDSPTGDGTLRWRGIARTDVDYDGELVWRFGVEPRSRVLEQSIGGDIEEAVPIRGIYLHSTACLRLTLTRSTTAAAGAVAELGELKVSGFFADNADLAEDVDVKLQSVTSGWGWDAAGGASLRAEAVSSGRWRITYRTGTTTAHYVTVGGVRADVLLPGHTGPSLVDAWVDPHATMGGASALWRDEAGRLVEPGAALDAGRLYTIEVDAPTPRSWLGSAGLPAVADGGSFPSDRIYLGGLVTPSAGMGFVLRRDGEEGGDEAFNTVATYDATSRWISTGLVVMAGESAALNDRTRVRLMRIIARGDVGDLVDALITESPDLAATGALPLVRADDWSQDWTELRSAIAGRAFASDRIYIVSQALTLGQMLEEHLKLSGCYLALDATGRLKIKRLGLTTSTGLASSALDASTTKGQRPSSTRSPEGQLAEVLVRTGYDPIENEHRGPTFRVRNVSAGHLAGGGILTIEPQSRRSSPSFRVDEPVEATPEDIYRLAEAVLGLYGSGYQVITLQAGLERFEAEIGDTMLLTSRYIPGPDGTLGVQQRVAQLVGYDWSPEEGVGSFELLAHDRRIAGYAPDLPVASQVNTTGDTWELTVTTSGYADGGASDWYAAGDEVRVVQRGTKTPTRLSGTVTASTATVVTVTFDSTWTPGSSAWRLGWDRAPAVDVTPPSGRRWAQTAFAFIAGTDRRVGFSSGDVDAYELAP